MTEHLNRLVRVEGEEVERAPGPPTSDVLTHVDLVDDGEVERTEPVAYMHVVPGGTFFGLWVDRPEDPDADVRALGYCATGRAESGEREELVRARAYAYEQGIERAGTALDEWFAENPDADAYQIVRFLAELDEEDAWVNDDEPRTGAEEWSPERDGIVVTRASTDSLAPPTETAPEPDLADLDGEDARESCPGTSPEGETP